MLYNLSIYQTKDGGLMSEKFVSNLHKSTMYHEMNM